MTWGSTRERCASGGAGSRSCAWTGCDCPGAGGAADRESRTGRRWWRWPASFRGHGVPLSRWTGPELGLTGCAGLVSGPVSASSVLRILAENPVSCGVPVVDLPRDPDFEAKASVVLDLYQGFYQGKPLAGRPVLSPTRSRRSGPQPRDTRRCRPRRAPVRVRARVRATRRARAARLPRRPGRVSPPPGARTGIEPFMDLDGRGDEPGRSTRTLRGCSSSWTTAQITAAGASTGCDRAHPNAS